MMLGFMRLFEKKIVSGEKRHTIRDKSKRKWEAGVICDCFVNPQQKTMRLLGRWPCVKVDDIRITLMHEVFINGERLGFDECVSLAVADGFESFADMMVFWRGRLPFEGDTIREDNKCLNFR